MKHGNLLALGILAASAGAAYLVLRKPAEQATSGALVGLQVLPLPGKPVTIFQDGNVTQYDYVYPAPNPMVAIGRLRGLSLPGPNVFADGEAMLAWSTT